MIAFEVKDMTCGHCVSAITKALKATDKDAKAVSYTHLDVYKRQVVTVTAVHQVLQRGLHRVQLLELVVEFLDVRLRQRTPLPAWPLAVLPQAEQGPATRGLPGRARRPVAGGNRCSRPTLAPVSYTHLDVYKRQPWRRSTRPG